MPVLVILLAVLVYVVIEAGGIISEYSMRKKTEFIEVENFINNISDPGTPENIEKVIKTSALPQEQREILIKLAGSTGIGNKSREVMARKMIEEEELKAIKRTEKTDIIAKIGPALGLIATLIPMGPGLAALGAGDINTLSQNLIIAFDAAILGLTSAAIAYTISKVRKRWYEDQISTLEALAESILEVLENAKETKKADGN
jgi:biopolymer transport protein ExbB/TolQ